VCEADSDGDGRTNGEELGDPKCQWSTNGHILLSNLTVTHPGIVFQFPHLYIWLKRIYAVIKLRIQMSESSKIVS
jgi:hypothetical protein